MYVLVRKDTKENIMHMVVLDTVALFGDYMTTIETKTFNKDRKPLERHIKKFCPDCGNYYYADICRCKKK